MSKHLLLSTLFLAMFSTVFGNVYTVTSSVGNYAPCGGAGSFMEAVCNANTNPGRDTIRFSVASLTGASAVANVTGEVFIDGSGTVTMDGIQVHLNSDNSLIANMTINMTSWQHTVLINGSNNVVRNSNLSCSTGADNHTVLIQSGLNNSIISCNITGQGHGISLDGSGNNIVDSCTVSNCGNIALIVRAPGNNTIRNTTIQNGAANGLGVEDSDNNNISNVISRGNAWAGITVEAQWLGGTNTYPNNNTITNCEVSNNGENGVVILSNNTILEKTKVFNNCNSGTVTTNAGEYIYGGIRVRGGANTIDSCYVYGNGANGILIDRYELPQVNGGAIIDNASNSLVRNCLVGMDASATVNGNNWNGIYVIHSNDVTVENSVVVSNGKNGNDGAKISGIRYEETSGGTIQNNYIGTNASNITAGNDFDGITLYTNANNILVTDNYICHNGVSVSYPGSLGGGIAMRAGSINNTITSNIIGVKPDLSDGGNEDYGISIEDGSGHTIGGTNVSQGNIIANTKNTGNQGCGIWLVLPGSTSNTVDNNVIRDNAGDGILIERGAVGNIIGTSNGGNIITGNENGINVKRGTTGQVTNNNTLRYNSFACNTNKGIALSDNGNNLFGGVGVTKQVTTVTADPRPNFISGNAPAGSTVDIYSTASATLTTCPATCKDANNQGATFTGVSVPADPITGRWEYDFVAGVGSAVVNQSTVVVLATETPTTAGTANTSEFSNCGCSAPTNVTISANDSTLCTGETALLTASANGIGSGSYSYKWYLGSSIVTAGAPVKYALSPIDTFRVSAAGTYFVKIADMQDTLGCVDSSAGLPIVVNTLPTINVAAASNSICDGESTTINSGQTNAANEVTLWSTGESTNPITVTTGGTFSVTITNTVTNCESTGSANVTLNPAVTTTLSNQAICQGDSVTLDATISGANISYLWAPGNETTPTLNVKAGGTYTVTVTNTATTCNGQATSTVTQSPDPKPIVNIAGTDTICFLKGESADVIAKLDLVKPGTFVWSKGASTDSLANIADTGYVSVTFTDAYNCADTDSLLIVNYCIPPTSEVPNVFIPGGTDNPTFTPVGTITPADVVESSFIVYNRWGRKMFETTDFPVWDGTLKGNPCSSGVYFWIWKYSDVTRAEYNLNGFVHLVRK